MPGNPSCTVYIGNLDEKVNDRVLYEIMIQAGRLVDMYIPRDKETDRPKGFAFAEYETEENADYAVRLFSGLVTLVNKTLRFAISGQDRPNNQNGQNQASFVTPVSKLTPKPRSQPMRPVNTENLQQPMRPVNTENFQQPHLFQTPCRFSTYTQSASPNYPQAPGPAPTSNGCRSDLYRDGFDYNRHVFERELDAITPKYDRHVFEREMDAITPKYDRHVFGRELDYNRRVLEAGSNSINRYEAHLSRARQYPIPYPSF